MGKRLLTYGFPFFLIFIEFLLRNAYRLDTEEFIGPTLAAVGVSLLLPLIVPKKIEVGLTQQTKQELDQKKVRILYKSEDRFIDIVWIFIFILTACWAYTLYISAQKDHIQMWMTFPNYKVLGFSNYFLGVLFSEVKEVV